MTQWLYRVLESDDDGDPLDFGVVRAATVEEAQESVRLHLRTIFGADFSHDVKFYEVTGWENNVILTDVLTIVTITGRKPRRKASG